ncbi:MAG: accessory gene regulator ArgB-like protein [Tissierella sp.]
MTSYFVINGIIEDGEREIYSYGLHQALLIIINIGTAVLIGFLFQRVWEVLIFMVTYIPLRTYGGGYHAKTEMKCYFFSIALIIVSLLLIKVIPITKLLIITLCTFSGIIVYTLAPVEDKNKILNYIQINLYRRKTRLILGIETLTVLVLYLLGFKTFSFTISLAIFLISLMMIAGRVKNGRI